jgi:hypothetical protein
MASRARAVATPNDWVKSSTRPRWKRSATTPAKGPKIIMGAERAKAARPTMKGEPVSWSASQASTTRSIQRAALTQKPEIQSRR